MLKVKVTSVFSVTLTIVSTKLYRKNENKQENPDDFGLREIE